jgi:hypothetical protein
MEKVFKNVIEGRVFGIKVLALKKKKNKNKERGN